MGYWIENEVLYRVCTDRFKKNIHIEGVTEKFGRQLKELRPSFVTTAFRLKEITQKY